MFKMDKKIVLGAVMGASLATGGTLAVDATASDKLRCTVVQEFVVDAQNTAKMSSALGHLGWRHLTCVSDGNSSVCRIGDIKNYTDANSVPQGSSCERIKEE